MCRPARRAGNYDVVVTNAFGSITSSNAVLTMAVPPTITSQPANVTLVVGTSGILSVIAAGTPPLNYQWSFGGNDISGATNSALTLANIQYSQAGNYAVTITNLAGSVTSSNAVLTVIAPSPCTPAPSGLVRLVGGEKATRWTVPAPTTVMLAWGGVIYVPRRSGRRRSPSITNLYAATVFVGSPASLQLQDFTVEAWIQLRQHHGKVNLKSDGMLRLIFLIWQPEDTDWALHDSGQLYF